MKRRRVTWADRPPTPLPKRPYRDTVIVNVGLAMTIVLVSWLTGGRVRNAVIIAAAFFVVATAWSFRVWRQKLRDADAEARRRR
jgi:Flp pilus assembly protein TadB